MKKLFLFAAAAALLAACSSKDDLSTGQQPAAATDDGAVSFEAYTGRAATRGGWAGSLTTTKLKMNGANDAQGFGVFGYYTDNNEYDQRSVPNFFYNQRVYYGTSAWEYSPVKYWPNEYGNNAVSEDQDKVTYFAYAPYINVVATSGKLADASKDKEQWGIVSMTRNSNPGDPILNYIASFNASKSVDLCWGVADNGDGVWPINKGGNQAIANGEPWIDVERPASTNQKVKFTFKHALAQMRVNIDADVNVDGRDPSEPVDKRTRVWVRSVTFKGFATKGALNLHNDDANKPKWLDYNGLNELVAEDVTVYDGRKDGKEGVAGAIATNEKVTGLNPALVQDGIYETDGGTDVYDNDHGLKVQGTPTTDEEGATGDAANCIRPGVTKDAVNLFAQGNKNENGTGDGAIFHVIPVDEPFVVEIVYDIETVSGNLAQNLSDGQTKGSSIENRILKEVSFGRNALGEINKLEAGHSYTLNLHLGMTSVKFDATVSDWIEEPAQDVDLPLNAPIYAANTTPSVTLPYVQPNDKYIFAIKGLNGGESVTHAWTDPTTPLASWSAETTTNAWSNGYDVITLTTAANPLTYDRTQKAKWTGNQSNLETTITFTQAGHPLFMKITEVNPSDKTITLTRYNDANKTASGHWTTAGGWLCDNAGTEVASVTAEHYIKVWRNGVELDNSDLATSETSGNKFKFDNDGTDETTAKITLLDTPQSGDIYQVEIKTGSAPAETVYFQVL